MGSIKQNPRHTEPPCQGRSPNQGTRRLAKALRELIEHVVERIGDVVVEITGRLNVLLGEKAWPNGLRSSVGSLVAKGCLCATLPRAAVVLQTCPYTVFLTCAARLHESRFLRRLSRQDRLHPILLAIVITYSFTPDSHRAVYSNILVPRLT